MHELLYNFLDHASLVTLEGFFNSRVYWARVDLLTRPMVHKPQY
jgi:hypothetical protein